MVGAVPCVKERPLGAPRRHPSLRISELDLLGPGAVSTNDLALAVDDRDDVRRPPQLGPRLVENQSDEARPTTASPHENWRILPRSIRISEPEDDARVRFAGPHLSHASALQPFSLAARSCQSAQNHDGQGITVVPSSPGDDRTALAPRDAGIRLTASVSRLEFTPAEVANIRLTEAVENLFARVEAVHDVAGLPAPLRDIAIAARPATRISARPSWYTHNCEDNNQEDESTVPERTHVTLLRSNG
jgi:hypothetical protein